EGLRGTGLSARFFAREGEGFRALDGAPLPEDVALGLEALSEGRPVFGGASRSEPSHVYLPLGTSLSEVLWVAGEGLRPSSSSVLELFAKVVGAALTDTRLLADVERGRWEMVAVAEVARFVAQPEPPTPEDFLARLTSLLGADAAALYSPEEGRLVLSAQVGLEGDARAALAAPPGALESAASSARGAVLVGEAESRALPRLSAGRLGEGAAVCLSPGEQTRGLLLVLRPPGHPFGSADLRLLGTLSELLVTLLEQRRLRAESSRQLADTRLLLDLARTTAATLEVATILDVAADFLVRLLDVSNCFIMLHDEHARVLRGAAASATHRDFFRTVSIPLDDAGSVAARAARELRPVVVPDVEKESDVLPWEFARLFEERALLVLPLTSREELIGVVLVDDTRRPRPFGPAFIELAEATCGQIALAIANARLYESLWASYAELAATRAEMVKRERLAAVVDLSAIVAHEVRNPLGVIFNAVASLRRMLRPEGDTAMLLDILAEESDRLNRMVGDLLDYTRPREAMLQPEDVHQVLKDALESARALQLAAGGVEFSAEVEPDLPQVPVDRRLMRQALVNVLVNAIQSMPQGGTVRVRARREGHAGRGSLRIDVADQGCGIP
ncbi:MAG TPA: GAF domain-containing protein, partial [Myxococcaceae bacterium]|nr:GAF domain-containing protein [Myxococcaceae bacterium]